MKTTFPRIITGLSMVVLAQFGLAICPAKPLLAQARGQATVQVSATVVSASQHFAAQERVTAAAQSAASPLSPGTPRLEPVRFAQIRARRVSPARVEVSVDFAGN